jgi:hypothetical protein
MMLQPRKAQRFVPERQPAVGRCYFFLTGWQVHFSAGCLQPEQTLSLISRPHFLHGEQPHVWHIGLSFREKPPLAAASGTAEETFRTLCLRDPATVQC